MGGAIILKMYSNYHIYNYVYRQQVVSIVHDDLIFYNGQTEELAELEHDQRLSYSDRLECVRR